MVVVFVSGPYRGGIIKRIHNIWIARKLSIQLWKQGYAVVCPHMNSAMMKEGNGKFLAGYIEILKRCDAALFLEGWEKSEGCRQEKQACDAFSIPHYFSTHSLRMMQSAKGR